MDHTKTLRQSQTGAEALLWRHLRNAQLGVKFRRQHRVAGYILDFTCIERGLAIEVDGSQHFEQAAYDQRRTTALEGSGLRVLRFWNNDVLQNTDNVLNSIVAALDGAQPPHPNPLPRYSRGRGSRSNGSRDGNGGTAATPPSPPTRFLSGERVGVRGLAPRTGNSSTNPLPRAASSLGERRPQPERAALVRGLASRNANGPAYSASGRREAIRLRAHLNILIRDFFAQRGVTEVETPILSAAGNTEPNIDGFSTQFRGPIAAGARERFLRTSPEHPLKRLLAAGVGDCYELGRVFRNGEAGRSHNPEFTMLEWYRIGFDHRRLALETAQLVRAALALVGRDASVTTTSYRDWFECGLGIDPFTADETGLRAPLAKFRIDPEGLKRDDWLDLLVTHRLQPTLPDQGITIVYDFPASQCSLARVRRGNPPVAERFELYLGGHELANGYHELNDAAEQRARFERENLRRREHGLDELPLDENLLAVLDDLPDCAGVALGVDRLLMHLLDTDDIRDVVAFPFAEA
jgi:lysyl-tRNA synthetase class 2